MFRDTLEPVRRAIDQTTFGDISIYTKLGWSNYTGVQLELERRFSKGVAFQMFYVMGNAFNVWGRANSNGGYTDAGYQPGAVPSDVGKNIDTVESGIKGKSTVDAGMFLSQGDGQKAFQAVTTWLTSSCATAAGK